jgi:ATP-dependent protease ClpP protease subunit
MSVIVNGNEIVLSGTVGEMYFEDCFTASDVIVALAQVGDASDVTIRLNSGGGIATEGSAIHSAIARHSGKKTIIVEGIAASAASVIAMAADDLVMSLGALMMIHDPSGFTFGTVKDHELQIETLTAIGQAMASIYAKKSGQTQAQCRADMESETWLTADEAVSRGYADRALGAANDNGAEPTAFNYRTYKNPPERIVALADARAWAKRVPQAAQSAASTSHQESPMANTPADKPAPANPTPSEPSNPNPEPANPQPTNVVDIDTARSQGRNDALAYVREINEICALAGEPGKAQAFIEKDAKPADVRKELLNARASADAAREVSNQNAPNNSQKPVAKVDLVADMKRRHGITA